MNKKNHYETILWHCWSVINEVLDMNQAKFVEIVFCYPMAIETEKIYIDSPGLRKADRERISDEVNGLKEEIHEDMSRQYLSGTRKLPDDFKKIYSTVNKETTVRTVAFLLRENTEDYIKNQLLKKASLKETEKEIKTRADEKLTAIWDALKESEINTLFPKFLQDINEDRIEENIANTIYYCVRRHFLSFVKSHIKISNQQLESDEILYETFATDYQEYNTKVMTYAYGNVYRLGALRALAEKGNAIAVQELGDMYYYGTLLKYNGSANYMNIKADKGKAFSCYKKGAKNRYPASMWAYADMVLNGIAPKECISPDITMLDGIDELVLSIRVWPYYAPSFNSIGAFFDECARNRVKEINVSEEEKKRYIQRSIPFFYMGYILGSEFSRNRLMRLNRDFKQFLLEEFKKGFCDVQTMLVNTKVEARDLLDLNYPLEATTKIQMDKDEYESFLKALYEECNEDNPYGQNLLGNYWWERGEYEKAEKAYLLAIEGKEKWGYKNLMKRIYGNGCYKEDESKYKECLEQYNELLSRKNQ